MLRVFIERTHWLLSRFAKEGARFVNFGNYSLLVEIIFYLKIALTLGTDKLEVGIRRSIMT